MCKMIDEQIETELSNEAKRKKNFSFKFIEVLSGFRLVSDSKRFSVLCDPFNNAIDPFVSHFK